MTEQLGVILDLGVALVVACLGGLLAVRVRQSPLVGYLLAGIIIGPFTPGFVGSAPRIGALAEIGIIFLLFALGVEFSLEELGRVRGVALLGTALQLLMTGALGMALGLAIGWEKAQALYLGAIIALSSTVVILKTLLARGETESTHGRVLLGMLIVQDLAAVALIVLLPSLTVNGDHLAITLAMALAKALLFIVGTLLLSHVVPRLLDGVARLGSEELFILSTAALALGAALAATALGLSTALGAFLAGLVVGRSQVEHHVLALVTPLRDLFVSLFFVSVGMLVDPRYAWEHPLLVVGVALAVLVVKSIVGTAVARLPVFHLSGKTSLFVGLGLAQVGEFSFVLAQQGVEQHVLVAAQYTLVLTTSVLTLIATPALFGSAPRLDRVLARVPMLGAAFRPRLAPTDMEDVALGPSGHVIVVGCGRVGSRVARALAANGFAVVGIDQDLGTVETLRQDGVTAIYGDAGYRAVLAAADPARARALVVALPDLGAARVVVQRARAANPKLIVLARATTSAAVPVLREAGAATAVVPALEGGLELLRHTLAAVGMAERERQAIVDRARTAASDEDGATEPVA